MPLDFSEGLTAMLRSGTGPILYMEGGLRVPTEAPPQPSAE